MKLNRFLVLALTALAMLLSACQPATPPSVTIIDGDKTTTLETEERVPSAIFSQAGITLYASDRVLSNGIPVTLDQPVDDNPTTLQIRRAVTVTIISSNGQQDVRSSAFTVGETLQEAGIQPQASDMLDPPMTSPINGPLTITYFPSRILTVNVDGDTVQVTSSARTVGEVLAEAGIPLIGLDYSLPSENEALPSDGNIKVVRVNESVALIQKPIPFENELIASTEVPLDQVQILSPGENGLSIQRVRIRYEDGNEVSRVTEEETMVRPPQARTLAYGTKVEVKTEVVDGKEIEYWRAVPMYATSYSPCRLGISTCGSTTASGKQLKKGMVALRTDLYLILRNQPVFIPGYGFATVEDACGGCVGKAWIDLGFSDDDFEAWHQPVTVYFLTPVPQNIPYTLE